MRWQRLLIVLALIVIAEWQAGWVVPSGATAVAFAILCLAAVVAALLRY